MTYAISVPTPFNDISELAESFASRADEERLMLPNHEPVTEGEWVQFVVTFADGSSALAGVGRCSGSYDNGEDRAAEHRFDVVMDSLDLDEMGRVYFERILVVRASQMGGEPTTGEVQLDEGYEQGEVQAAPAEAYAAEPEAAPEYDAGAYAEAAAEGQAYEGEPAAEAPAEAYVDPQAYAEPAPDAYAEAPVEAYAEAPVEAYAEAPVEAYAEAPADAQYAEAYADPQAYAEAPADAYVEAQPDAYAEAPADAQAYAEQPIEAPPEALTASAADDWDDPSEATQMGDIASIMGDGERLAAPVQAIYELPAPTAPGMLPSPHANTAVLTRRHVEASWSPQPMLRPDPGPSSGLFQYGDAGLPKPAHAPRPQLDPSLRVVRAPLPSDPLAAPMASAAVADAYAEVPPAYDEAAPAEAPAAYDEAAYAEEAYAEAPAYDEQAEEAHAEAQPAYDEAAYAADDYAEEQVEAVEEVYAANDVTEVPQEELADAADADFGALEGETRQVDIGGLDEPYTVDDVAIPSDDELT